MALMAILASYVYSLYFMLINGSDMIFQNLIENYGQYMTLVATIMMLIMGIVDAVSIVPLQIACGSKRVAAALSVSITNLITSVEIIIYMMIYYILVPGVSLANSVDNIIIMLELFVLATGLSSLLAVPVMKYGKWAYFLAVFVNCTIAGAASGLMVTSAKVSDMFNKFNRAFAIVSVVVLIIGNIAITLYSKYMEVK